MSNDVIDQLVEQLLDATERGATIELISQRYPSFTLEQAYAVQRGVMERRLQRGARVVGWKVGYTNAAAQRQAGTDRPMYGPIYADTVVRGRTFAIGRCVAPRAEPEICFVMGRDLAGPRPTAEEVLEATAALLPAIEVVQRHYQGPDSKAVDAIADGGAHAALILPEPSSGAGVSPRGLDLPALTMTLQRGAETLAEGNAAIVLGNPVNAVIWLVEQLHERGLGLRAGDLVSSGTLGGAHPIQPGDLLRLTIAHLGQLEVNVTA